MLTTGIISFREFLEAFLIVGVFLGISRKLVLNKEKEIILAAVFGFAVSITLATLTYTFGSFARDILTHERAEILESYLLIFSGIFLAYVIFSLHKTLQKSRGGKLIEAHQKMQKRQFDFSLFVTISALVIREGFEIALFTASTSLFAVFMQNFLGLILGFASASVVGFMTFFTYLKFPIGKVYRVTEYMIVLLGASLVQNGITELLEHVYHIELSDMLRLPFGFLPDSHSVLGHLIQSMTGLDREFSVARLSIMLVYIGIIYLLFLKRATPLQQEVLVQKEKISKK